MQTFWELFITGFVTSLFWCAAHPFITCAACFSAVGFAIWQEG